MEQSYSRNTMTTRERDERLQIHAEQESEIGWNSNAKIYSALIKKNIITAHCITFD